MLTHSAFCYSTMVLLLCALIFCIAKLRLLQRAEQSLTIALAASKKRFHSLLDHLPDAIILWQDGHAIYANKAALKLLQVRHAKEIKTLYLSHSANQELDIDACLNACQPWPLREMSLNLPGMDLVQIETTASITDYHDQPALHITIRDISERKKIELQNQHLLQILDHNSDYVALVDEQDQLIYANPTTRALFQDGEPQQHTLMGLHSNQEQHAVVQHYLVEAKHNGSYHVETLLHNHDGAPIPVSVVYIALCHENSHKNACYTAMIARDLRPEMTMQSRMEQSQRLESMGKLAGGIAHDFNNIMMAVLGNATLARMRFGEDSPATVYLQRIENSGKRAAQLCKQMLAYSGRTHFNMKAMDLSRMAESMQEWVQSSMSSSISINYQLADQPLAIRGDKAQLEQSIMNLLLNAGEAIEGHQGNIIIKTSKVRLSDADIADVHGDIHISAGNFACLTISDDGCGMSYHVCTHVFDPFFTTKFSGRGLGMSTVLGVVRGHHGGIRIQSQPEHGTEVSLYFPLHIEDQTISTAKQPQQVKADDDFQATVLVVDDEDDVRETAVMMLEVFGYRTIAVSGGAEAIEQYAAHASEISIVLLDMSMPNMDGKACFQKLREIDPQVRVLLSSGHSEIEVGQIFMGQKLVGFIAKPYTPEELQRKLAELGSMTKSSLDG